MENDLFENRMTASMTPGEAAGLRSVLIAPGALLLRGWAASAEAKLLAALDAIAAIAPFRHMVTPGGFRMSVAITSCGDLGWTSDRRGYRYAACDPQSGQPWPAMPTAFADVARTAAAAAGYEGFCADSCLINRYEAGARMSLHQDRDERDLTQPIVSVSLGLPGRFLFGGLKRRDAVRRMALDAGDVVVWGGPSRLAYHGIAPLARGTHPLSGAYRYNLTFRRAA